MGGDKEPCINRAYIPQFEKSTGRPCPRVDIEAGNEEAASLAMAFANRIVAGEGAYGDLLGNIITGTLAAMAIREESPWKTHISTQRALSAINSEEISALLNSRIEANARRLQEQQEKKLAHGKSAAARRNRR